MNDQSVKSSYDEQVTLLSILHNPQQQDVSAVVLDGLGVLQVICEWVFKTNVQYSTTGRHAPTDLSGGTSRDGDSIPPSNMQVYFFNFKLKVRIAI